MREWIGLLLVAAGISLALASLAEILSQGGADFGVVLLLIQLYGLVDEAEGFFTSFQLGQS